MLGTGPPTGEIARMPPDEPSPPNAPEEPLPPLPPFHTAPPEERPLPRGCHPLVFGIVMATLQFAATLYFMPSCFHAPG
ncbi:hypothetical protein tb265_26760 [Gemmatimonadetes bacterium T265]|nr:hypothetical protein tb265_26760 [Gemmatimonadetes bacterium T265]